MFLVLLTACGTVKTDTAATETAAATVLDVALAPTAVTFGTIGISAPEAQVVTLTNNGTADVSVLAHTSTSNELTVSTLAAPVAPGASGDLTITWTPLEAEHLDASLKLLVGDTSGQVVELPLPVTGDAAGAALEISTTDVDMGTVSVGCTANATVTLHNGGATAVTIADVSLDEGISYTLQATDGSALPAFPWTLAGDESRDVQVVFTPREQGTLTDQLEVQSDDTTSPLLAVPITGSARIEDENSITYDVIRLQNITAVMVVNQIVAVGTYAARFDASLSVLFDSLHDSQAPYRVVFIINQNGETDGPLPYIDDTMTTEDAVAAAITMMENASGDLDTTFTTLESAFDLNRSWLVDEDDDWAEARLNLIGMNDDVEQSGGNYVTHMATMQTYKENPADVVFSGIGGDVPRGCGSGARPAQAFSDLAAATGGVFLSICDADWTSNMATLGEAMRGRNQTFELDGEPAEWSIRVWVDSVERTEGWTYEASKNTVIFDDESYPEPGSVVRIDYIYVTECE